MMSPRMAEQACAGSSAMHYVGHGGAESKRRHIRVGCRSEGFPVATASERHRLEWDRWVSACGQAVPSASEGLRKWLPAADPFCTVP